MAHGRWFMGDCSLENNGLEKRLKGRFWQLQPDISKAEQRVSPGSGVQKFFVKLPKTGSWIDS
jgi:hypothetical protein